MYTAFYGLREKPFSLTPNPRFIYLADSHREAMAHLLYGLEEGEGFIVISGEVGTGKTTICRSLLERLGSETEVAILFNPSQTAKELLQAISEEFALPSDGLGRREMLSQLNRFLLDKNRESRRVVLIVDEAQNLSSGTLEQVRLLSNLETTTSKLIQIILLGQPELDAKLDGDELRQLRQRVSVRWSLTALPQNDTFEYIKHRLQIAAGAPRDIFTPAALREIHRRARGIPRLINVLCDRALLAGFAAQSHRIGPKLVREAARELPDAARPRRLGRGSSGAGEEKSAFTPRSVLRWGAAVAALLVVSFWYGMTGGGKLAQRIVQPDPEPSYVAAESLAESPSAADDRAGVNVPPADVIEVTTEIEVGNGIDGDVAAVTVIAPMSPTAPPLQDEETWIGLPHEVSELSRPIGASPRGLAEEDGEFLAALLARQGSAEGELQAVNAILEAFGASGVDLSPTSAADLDALLAASDIAVLHLEDTNIETLLQLNYPAFLTLRGADGRERRVALLGLEDDIALLAGIGPSERLRVPVSAIEARWIGDAAIAWRAFEDIPEMVTYGDEGSAVIWVQSAMVRLGYLAPGLSGVYDMNTLGGVRDFQRRHQLEPDGVTGPMTQMLLYGALRDYAPPRLESPEAG